MMRGPNQGLQLAIAMEFSRVKDKYYVQIRLSRPRVPRVSKPNTTMMMNFSLSSLVHFAPKKGAWVLQGPLVVEQQRFS